MRVFLKQILNELLLEAMLGKKFPLILTKNGENKTLRGVASVNTKPGELPYRITWFTSNLHNNRHVDLTLDEMNNILIKGIFPPEIVQRIKDRYPDDNGDLIADTYTISAY